MKYVAITLLTLLTACNHTKDASDIFVVPILKKPVYQTNSKDTPPPPPERAYYFGFNFIVDSSGQIYYYQRELLRLIDGDGLDWDMPPPFINLKPKDIVCIPTKSIDDFIKLNILGVDTLARMVSIASTKDTIESAGLAKILQVVSDTSKHFKWLFRKATLEEKTVLDYKQRNTFYDPDEIKWDSTQIRFLPSLESMIKFAPPKVK